MTNFSLKQLYLRWFRKEASAEEQEAFLDQAADIDPADELSSAMYDAWNQLLLEMPAENNISSPLSEKIVKQFPAEAPVKKMNRPWLKLAAASVAAAVLILTVYILLPERKNVQPVSEVKADKEPGKDGAVLTLSDGSTVLLDTISNGLIAQQGNTAVKIENGNLVYDATGDGAISYNTMSTPRGRKFRLTLPDGTAVWLNAASTLKYPTVFTGSERLVEVNGEAYFEVAQNKEKPFKVKTNQQLIEVLGTRFNVQAYAEEDEAATTLLSGKVRVNANNSSALVLEPGFQAVSRRNNEQLQNQEADTLDVLSWKEGLFRFRNTSLILILKQLERWYDVRVDGDIPAIHYTGVINRNSPLSKVLHMLEETSKARFRLEIQPKGSNEKDKIIILK